MYCCKISDYFIGVLHLKSLNTKFLKKHDDVIIKINAIDEATQIIYQYRQQSKQSPLLCTKEY